MEKSERVRHIVLWKLKESAEGNSLAENALLIKKSLEALVGKIDGVLKIEVGINIVDGSGSDLGLYSEFESKAALDAYRTHPLHLEVQKFVHKVIESRVACDSFFG